MEECFSYRSSLDGIAYGGSGPVGFEEARVLHVNACLLVGLADKLNLHVLARLGNATACIAVLVHTNRPHQGSDGIAVCNCLG